MRIADKIFRSVAKYVDTVFFVPGGGSMYLVDALRTSGLHGVACLHEQGAGFAALGYAWYHGAGVALVTSGPGSTNILTPLAAAWTDSIPLIVIAGQAKSTSLIGNSGLRTSGVQEIDINKIVLPITKWCLQPDHTWGDVTWDETAWGDVIDDMFSMAVKGRPGPCWLTLPVDVQGREI